MLSVQPISYVSSETTTSMDGSFVFFDLHIEVRSGRDDHSDTGECPHRFKTL